MSSDEVITTQQAAEMLGLTKEAVSRLLRAGKLKGQRFGWAWAVHKSSVEEYQKTTANKSKFDPTRGKTEEETLK